MAKKSNQNEHLPVSPEAVSATWDNDRVAIDPPAGPRQGITLRTGFFRLDWTLRFTRTTVVIDGQLHELPWGEHFLPLEPGPHQVEVSYRYLHLSRAGKASVLINIARYQVLRASYQAPKSVLIAFLPGKLTVESPAQS